MGIDQDRIENYSNTTCMYNMKSVFLWKKKLSQVAIKQSPVFYFEW